MEKWKEIKNWFIALVISSLIANFLMPVYFYDPGWIKRDTGATQGIYEPGSMIIRGDEGYTVTQVDYNGYINQSSDLVDSGYILVMGNSQSNGNNVMPNKKWIALLNDKIQEEKEETGVQIYNISVGGYEFYNQVEGIKAAAKEFPHSDAVILQITTTNIPIENLLNIQQREFSEETRGGELIGNLTYQQKLRNGIKDYFPLLIYLAELKFPQIDISFENAFLQGSVNYGKVVSDNVEDRTKELEVYEDALREVFSLLKESYPGEIIILNIPAISIDEEANLVIPESEYDNIFETVCEQNDIEYLNMGAIYQENYEKYKRLPYGFANTKPGNGHLNEDGHKMVAEALNALFKEKGVIK